MKTRYIYALGLVLCIGGAICLDLRAYWTGMTVLFLGAMVILGAAFETFDIRNL